VKRAEGSPLLVYAWSRGAHGPQPTGRGPGATARGHHGD
jgi:hypothetical protein